MNFQEFLGWERASRDTIDFKKIYVDMAGGDVLAGLALSEIIYWYLPDKSGKSNKLRIKREGEHWIACRRSEWWDRARMTPKQIDRVIRILVSGGLIEKRVYKFAGSPTLHVRVLLPAFLEQFDKLTSFPISPKGKKDIAQRGRSISLNGQVDIAQRGRSLTETTAKITTENTKEGDATRLSPPHDDTIDLRFTSIPGGEMLDRQLSIAFNAGVLRKGRPIPQGYDNPQQRDQFRLVAEFFGDEFERVIGIAIAERGTTLPKILSYCRRWKDNLQQTKEGRHDIHKRRTPKSPPGHTGSGGLSESQREEARSYSGK